jgi:hypothetical protein
MTAWNAIGLFSGKACDGLHGAIHENNSTIQAKHYNTERNLIEE